MRRVLPAAEYRTWFDDFLPRLSDGEPATLLSPARVSDRTNGEIAHLDGLNLSRGWCWRVIAAALTSSHPLHVLAATAAERHLDAALPHVTGDYMGEHWLASFALLALMPPTPDKRLSPSLYLGSRCPNGPLPAISLPSAETRRALERPPARIDIGAQATFGVY